MTAKPFEPDVYDMLGIAPGSIAPRDIDMGDLADDTSIQQHEGDFETAAAAAAAASSTQAEEIEIGLDDIADDVNMQDDGHGGSHSADAPLPTVEEQDAPRYHSRRGDAKEAVATLSASWRPRLDTAPWPCKLQAVAYDSEAKRYIYSFSKGEHIPELPINEYPRLRTDFRLGVHDPMLYPQYWQHTAPHMAWIPKVKLHRDLYGSDITGYVMQPDDWLPVQEGASYGRLGRPLLARLQDCFYEIHALVLPLLRSARTRVLLPTTTITECIRLLADFQSLTATFRETAVSVTRILRGIAELRAFRLFRLDVKYHVGDELFVSDRMYECVGVFSTDSAMVTLLHRLGIPVWFVSKSMPPNMKHEELSRVYEHFRQVEMTPRDALDTEGRDWSGVVYRPPTPPYYPDDDEHVGTPRPQDDEPDEAPAPARGREHATRSVSHDRSRSPRPGRARARSPPRTRRTEPASRVPRYMLHEEPRLPAGSTSRRSAEAPDAWIARTWETDPGHQAAANHPLPGWVPRPPVWLAHVAASVDRSKMREYRLCAADVLHPVPQARFAEPLQYTMPPFHHLIAQKEERVVFVFRAWVALRNFWLRRIIREGFIGLSAKIWRKVLDDKYHTTPEHKAWVQENCTSLGIKPSDVEKASAPTSAVHVLPHPDAVTSTLAVNSDISSLLPPVSTAEDGTSAAYTRVPEVGEDLIINRERTFAEPHGWNDKVRLTAVFFERTPRHMYAADITDQELILAGNWDEFWDYERRRILLFRTSSRVPYEAASGPDKEILLNENALTWHYSATDEDGLAQGSRAMWMAVAPIREKTAVLLGRVIAAPPEPMVQGAAAGTGNKPPPDPVYGYEAEQPNGRAATAFFIGQHPLSVNDLSAWGVRAFLVWEVQETAFRFQLRDLDTYILKSMKVWNETVRQDREALWLKCWGGQDGFVPSGLRQPPHTDPNPENRKVSIYSLWKIVRAWPRCREVTNLRRYTATDGLSMEKLLDIEREVWSFYAQSFQDYFGILPTMPTVMPPNPFVK